MNKELHCTKSISVKWARFLTTSVPMPTHSGEVEDIAESGNVQLRAVIESAIENQILPKNTILAQFVHVAPESLDVDFEIPTAVQKKQLRELLIGCAIHGSFIKKTGLSLVRALIESRGHLGMGIICTMSRLKSKDSMIPGVEFYHTFIGNVKINKPLNLSKPILSKIKRSPIGGSQWDYVRGSEIAELFEVENYEEFVPQEVNIQFPPFFSSLLGNKTHEYFRHLSFLFTKGEVILCIPNIYSNSDQLKTFKEIGGGGVIYVVEKKISPNELRDLYVVANRMCGIVLGIWDTAKLISLKSKELGYQRGEYMISHELDTPIGILNCERTGLSDEGKMAVDYLELWRRFIKREWTEPLPIAIENLFESNDALLKGAFRFGYTRAIRRSLVPKLQHNGRPEYWSWKDLLKNRDAWLDVEINLLDSITTEANAPWVYQVKTWLLFFLISSCYHVIKFSFGNVTFVSNWQTINGLRRGAINISHEYNSVSDSYKIRIVNLGGVQSPEPICHEDYIKPIRSQGLGTINLPPVAKKHVKIRTFRALETKTREITKWLAEIIIDNDVGASKS